MINISYKAIFLNNQNNASEGSILNSALAVSVETGSTVTITNNIRTYETISKNGTASFSLLPFGQYEIHAVNGPKDWIGFSMIEEPKVYKVNVDYYTAKLLVYVEENAQIIAKSRGGGNL